MFSTLKNLVRKSDDFTKAARAAESAAKNMQTAFANFLFDPFQDGLSGMLSGFVNTLKRMASEALAVKIFEQINSNFGGSEGLGSVVSAIFSGARAGGGDVASNKAYLVGEKGPEIFVPGSAGSIVANQEIQQQSPTVNVRNINVLDPALVGDYLGTDAGEQIIMNIVQRNRRSLAF